MTKRRNVIVHIGTSADGYIARPDGDLEWLTSRAKLGHYFKPSFFPAANSASDSRIRLSRVCGRLAV